MLWASRNQPHKWRQTEQLQGRFLSRSELLREVDDFCFIVWVAVPHYLLMGIFNQLLDDYEVWSHNMHAYMYNMQ